MENNLFDLDLKVEKSSNGVEPRITSVAFCTPGTCACEDGPTFNSACCSVEFTIYNCK
ncbi:gallidermin/nisin family lantibiotic [Bacillus sp. FDAARGOS_1420]|uniref:gallidermin/nisin family lantibiotic n=1 Tax=unclassified Bacillus (in: firmicutes) TaxID=185979 RepID=UPI001C5AD722|nr:gallidermin/nisin family lantibiotic [Bacillus sp. FDAARGOS_1420]MBW3496120.1 gallidermin/nisin family lantibiotic [Bacillus sp. FDAARGOS_1420]